MIDNEIEIILVEDNPNDVKLALHAFEKHSLANRVVVLRDGAETLDFLFGAGATGTRRPTGCPRIILLDLKLPKVDGLEVLRRAKADPSTKAIPIVVMTSSREESDLIASYNLGANSYIVKPVDFDQFTEVVRQIGCYWLLLNEPPPPEKG